MDKEDFYGQIYRSMKVNLRIISYKDSVKWCGPIENSTKDIGRIIKCMVRVFSNGQMVESMKGTTYRIKNMALVE